MRENYRDQLNDLNEDLANMAAAVAQCMAEATRALLSADLELIEWVITTDSGVDTKRATVEEDAYGLLALQAPVAGELRRVVSAIHMAESLERMGDLTRHVVASARRRHPASALPAPVCPYFDRMGKTAVTLASTAERTLWTRDVALAMGMAEDDDEMDRLHRELFTVLMDPAWPHGVAAAIDVAQLARFYERFADHAVSVARQVVFVATGQLPG